MEKSIEDQYLSDYVRTEKTDLQILNHVKINEQIPKYITLNNGIVLPRKIPNKNEKCPYQGLGGVIKNNGEFLRESVIYDLKKENVKEQPIAFGGSYPIDNVEIDNRKVIYMGLAHQQWGHFLVDIVQRCWFPYIKYLKQHKHNTDYYYVFSGFGDGVETFGINYLDFFNLLGLNTEHIIIVNKPTKFKKVIVPDVVIYPGESINKVFVELIDTVIKNSKKKFINKKYIEKIYFSRTHLKDKKEIGEKLIEGVAVKAGFSVLYPEELTLTDQIFYWQTAAQVACVNGTIPHNCIFSHNSLELLIFNKTKIMVGYQFTMDKIQGLHPIYISAYLEPFNRYPIDVSRGPFWLDVTSEVKKIFKDKFNMDLENKRNALIWIKYLKICMIAEIKYNLRGSKAKLKLIMSRLASLHW